MTAVSRQQHLPVSAICLGMFAILAGPSFAREINVADHGIVPGKDVSFQLNRLVESIQGESGVTLVFPKGQYEFYPDNAVEHYRAIANHDNGLKRMAFPLFDLNDITIDGGGSTFMFHGRMVPITIERTQGAKLKNFSINWIRSFHAELKVVEIDAETKSFVVDCDPTRYPYDISGGQIRFERFGQEDPIGSNIVFDPKTSAPIYQAKSYSLNEKKATITPIAAGRFRIAGAVSRVPPVGSVIVVYGVHPTSRLCPAIHVTNSRDIELNNVTVYDAGGMALIVERTENVFLDAVVVTSAADRIAATRADATHFIGCKGTVRLQRCRFEHMLDDGINVHGAYVKVAESLGDRRFLCEISHFQQWGLTFAEPGDKVALLSRTTILPFAETIVEEVRQLNSKRFVLKVKDDLGPLPDGPLSMENLTWYPDLVMKENMIRRHRARSALITTKGKVLLENNFFSSQMHGILIEGDNNKWYESGAVNDITIRNNVFDNPGYQSGPVYPLLASPLLTDQQRPGRGYYHRNIKFVDNKIRSFSGHIVSAFYVKGLTIEGNRIEVSRDYPAGETFSSVDLRYCDDVKISRNRAVGYDGDLSISISHDATDVESDENDGFTASPSRTNRP